MISINLRGAEKFLESNIRFQRALTRTLRQSIKRGLGKTATKVRRELRGVPVARKITKSAWGREARNRLTARVKPITLRAGEDGLEAALGLYGYAAVLEGGGRLAPHTQTFRGHSFRHPGAVVDGHRIGARHLRRDASGILRQLDADVGRLVNRVYGL